jgi:hypothetical protein
MQISNEFRVAVPIEQAWTVLLDVERIAPCLPGAQLQEVEGDEYRGVVKIKVGPITAQYRGVARILEADEAERRIVIKGEGRDTRGQGNASATVTALLVAEGESTKVSIETDLQVTGKVAQFGRGVMADVSAKLILAFVDCLDAQVLRGSTTGEETAKDSTSTRSIDAPEVEALDLGRVAGGAIARRAIPVLVGLGVIVAVVVVLIVR